MNKKRRLEIGQIVSALEVLKDKIQDVLTEEEWAFDAMPENLQGSMRADESQEAQGNMSDAIDKIDEAIDLLNEVAG